MTNSSGAAGQPCGTLGGLLIGHAGDRTHKEIIITAIRKTLAATAVVGAVLAGSAACGTVEQVSAGKKLDQAFEKLGKEKSLSFELDLDVDAATLKQLDAESDPEPGEEIPDEAAKLLSNAKISVTVESGKPIVDSEEKDFLGMAMKVSTTDGDLAEYRVVGDYTYIRSDVQALSKAIGMPMPPADQLPPEAKGLKKMLDGEWVKFSTEEMEKAGQGLGQEPGAAAPSPEPTLDAKTQKKLLDALRGVIARKVEFKTAGGEDGTEHITATAPFRSLITELFGEIRPLTKDLPPGMDLPSDEDLKDAPETDVSADFTLKNGELTEVYVDLAKLAESAKVKKFGLALKMSAGTRPTAPAGATELHLDELMQGFLGGMAQDASFEEDELAEGAA
ncbi:hypothetical protein [Streptomyces venezuelae]|uniref:Uncharacterized protein n=1 Tax=Streptomyces venezuelae (strain ATCC 10712 / CBS 650.69 / DSM 40230 / JCM 4526 / NBRC 13096 / PD 04745) TaxID=953739 RepID=F2RLV7_STRVP|nr:hypothetical protein SVEN_7201 [Streptomyces venezuelae ATCC 10712]